MANQEQAKASAFPTPPSFYTHFTVANKERLSKLKQEANLGPDSEAGHDLSAQLDLPEQLQHLVPPKPPGPEESWYVFGEHKTLPPNDLPYLDPSTPLLHPLPPSPDSISRLTRGALLAFLEISHILARDPTPDRRFGSKWEDLRDLLINAHRAVNLYRPWAARQQLIRTLEGYVADARAEVAHIADLNGRVDTLLKDLAASGGDAMAPVYAEMKALTADGRGKKGSGSEGRDVDDEKSAWDVITEAAA